MNEIIELKPVNQNRFPVGRAFIGLVLFFAAVIYYPHGDKSTLEKRVLDRNILSPPVVAEEPPSFHEVAGITKLSKLSWEAIEELESRGIKVDPDSYPDLPTN